MREKPRNQVRSKFHPIIEDDISSDETDVMTHQLIEALSEKIEDMNKFISQTHSLLNLSSSNQNHDFRSSSDSNSNSSTTGSNINPSSSYEYKVNLNNINSNSFNNNCSNDNHLTSSDQYSTSTDDSSNLSRENKRIQGSVISGVGGTAGSQQISPDIILMGASNYEYTTGESSTTYQYGFTDSEFIAFIGALDPIEYILVIVVIAILIATQLNVNERQLIGGALIDIGVTIGNIVEQEFFQRARQNEIRTRQRHEALQCDIQNIYRSLVLIQEEINELKDELKLE